MTIKMFDSISLSQIPADAEAVAGYVGGRWPTFVDIPGRWPNAHHLSIAVASFQDAECLDVEQGDATNQVAAAWVKRQQKRGIAKPVIYTSVSNVAALLRALKADGISRSDIRLWTAHYTMREHLCDSHCGLGMPTTADATQWTDRALGKMLDQSLCADGFFGATPKPAPKPTPAPAKKGTLRDWLKWVAGGRKGKRPNVPKAVPKAWWRTLSLAQWYAGLKNRKNV